MTKQNLLEPPTPTDNPASIRVRVLSGQQVGARSQKPWGQYSFGHSIENDLILRDLPDSATWIMALSEQMKTIENRGSVPLIADGIVVEAGKSYVLSNSNVVHQISCLDVAVQVKCQRSLKKTSSTLAKPVRIKQGSRINSRMIFVGAVLTAVSIPALSFIMHSSNQTSLVAAKSKVILASEVAPPATDLAQRLFQLTQTVHNDFGEKGLSLSPAGDGTVLLEGQFQTYEGLSSARSFARDSMPGQKIVEHTQAARRGPAKRPESSWLATASVLRNPDGDHYLRTREGEVYMTGGFTPDRWTIASISQTSVTVQLNSDEVVLNLKR